MLQAKSRPRFLPTLFVMRFVGVFIFTALNLPIAILAIPTSFVYWLILTGAERFFQASASDLRLIPSCKMNDRKAVIHFESVLPDGGSSPLGERKVKGSMSALAGITCETAAIVLVSSVFWGLMFLGVEAHVGPTGDIVPWTFGPTTAGAKLVILYVALDVVLVGMTCEIVSSSSTLSG